MRFTRRKEIADKYREWVKQQIDNNQTMILDCAESVIAFLDINGYLTSDKGKWIRITQGAIPEQYMCPFCHRTVEIYGVEELLPIRYPYCHCGADMRGETDEIN